MRTFSDEVPRIEFDEALQSLLELVSKSILAHPNCPMAVELREALVIWCVTLPMKVRDILPALEFDVDNGKADVPLPTLPSELCGNAA